MNYKSVRYQFTRINIVERLYVPHRVLFVKVSFKHSN